LPDRWTLRRRFLIAFRSPARDRGPGQGVDARQVHAVMRLKHDKTDANAAEAPAALPVRIVLVLKNFTKFTI